MYWYNKIIVILTFLILPTKAFTKEGMPQFNVESFPSQLFWLFITFSFLYLFITFIILPRIRENIRLRKNKISNDIERATATKSQAQEIISEYNKKIEEAKIKARNMIKNTAKRANLDFDNQINSVKKQLENKIIASEKELLLAKQEMENSIEVSAEEISNLIVEKVLKT